MNNVYLPKFIVITMVIVIVVGVWTGLNSCLSVRSSMWKMPKVKRILQRMQWICQTNLCPAQLCWDHCWRQAGHQLQCLCGGWKQQRNIPLPRGSQFSSSLSPPLTLCSSYSPTGASLRYMAITRLLPLSPHRRVETSAESQESLVMTVGPHWSGQYETPGLISTCMFMREAVH